MVDFDRLAAEPLYGLPLPELWFGLLFFLFGMFLFLDGFDFGVGALFATRDDETERETLLAAIGPVWDGNEVWLVVFGGALFATFPAAYANLFSRHYLLMFAILAALIARGTAPELFEQRDDDRWRRFWGRAFAAGSVTTPFLIGLFVGAWVLGRASSVTLPGIVFGLALVALSVADGAAFLGLKTRGSLAGAAERSGVIAAIVYLALILGGLGIVYATEPTLRSAILRPAALGLIGLTAVLVVGYVSATRRRRRSLAFGAAGALVFSLVGLVAVLLFPAIDPRAGLTIREAVVSTLPLNLMSIGMAFFLPLVLGYFVVLYRVFAGPADPSEGY